MSKYSENMPPSLLGAVEWMIGDIKPNSLVLDMGCSTGYFGKYLKDTKSCTVYGVEISEDIKQARKVLDGVYLFDLDGDWPDEVYERKYDYLFYGDVIEHLKDPGKVLEKSKKLLKKDGLLFISTPNVAHIGVRLELMGGNFEYESMGILDNTHLKYFTKRSLERLVKDAGYKLKSIDFSADDYPDSVIKNILDKYGLVPNNKFWKMIDKPEARAYQYKLIVQPADSTPAQRSEKSKDVTFEKPGDIRNAAMNDLSQKVENLQRHSEEQAKIISHYVEENQRLHDENNDIAKRLNEFESSFSSKATRRVSRLLRGQKGK